MNKLLEMQYRPGVQMIWALLLAYSIHIHALHALLCRSYSQGTFISVLDYSHSDWALLLMPVLSKFQSYRIFLQEILGSNLICSMKYTYEVTSYIIFRLVFYFNKGKYERIEWSNPNLNTLVLIYIRDHFSVTVRCKYFTINMLFGDNNTKK